MVAARDCSLILGYTWRPTNKTLKLHEVHWNITCCTNIAAKWKQIEADRSRLHWQSAMHLQAAHYSCQCLILNWKWIQVATTMNHYILMKHVLLVSAEWKMQPNAAKWNGKREKVDWLAAVKIIKQADILYAPVPDLSAPFWHTKQAAKKKVGVRWREVVVFIILCLCCCPGRVNPVSTPTDEVFFDSIVFRSSIHCFNFLCHLIGILMLATVPSDNVCSSDHHVRTNSRSGYM